MDKKMQAFTDYVDARPWAQILGVVVVTALGLAAAALVRWAEGQPVFY